MGTYRCRNIEGKSRPSEHASANAIDISGFTLKDGRKISVLHHWRDNGPEAKFLRGARVAACRYFRATLGPNYNTAHADHFHFDRGVFWACKITCIAVIELTPARPPANSCLEAGGDPLRWKQDAPQATVRKPFPETRLARSLRRAVVSLYPARTAGNPDVEGESDAPKSYVSANRVRTAMSRANARNSATEASGMCKRCHDKSLVGDVAAPFGEAAFGEAPFGAPKPSDG